MIVHCNARMCRYYYLTNINVSYLDKLFIHTARQNTIYETFKKVHGLLYQVKLNNLSMCLSSLTMLYCTN